MAELRPRKRFLLLAGLLMCAASTASWADLSAYSQDFEGLIQSDPDALANDGWLVYGNVYDGTTGALIGWYGPFPAPNGGEAFCAIDTGQGGPEQGAQQLSVYNDYNNTTAHNNGDIVEANVFQEQIIGAADIDKVYTFAFDAKRGNIGGSSTALAFIKLIDPNSGFSLTIQISEDMTSIPVEWVNYSITIVIRSDWVGQLLQFGFLSTATSFESSGIFYDNLAFGEDTNVAVGDQVAPSAFALNAATPNPFNPRTTLTFELSRESHVRLQVFDAAGHLVRTLVDDTRLPGEHSAVWDGRDDSMRSVASGLYFTRMAAGDFVATRRLVLLK